MKIKMRSDEGLGGAHLSVHPWFAQPGDEADVPEDEGWALVQNGYADVLDIDDQDPTEDPDEDAGDQAPVSPTEDHQPETEQAVEALVTEQRATAQAPVKAPAKRAAAKRSS